MRVDFSVTNQLATPAINAAALANRPAAGQPGRVFIDTDNPSTGMYRDTGTAWVQIAAGGGLLNLQTVTDFGNTTTNEVTIGSATAPTASLDVYGGGDNPDIVAKIQGTSTNSAFIQFTQNGAARFFTGNRYKGGANLFIIGNSITPQDTFLINHSTNRIAIGGHTDTPAYLLSIGGTLQNTTSAYLATDSGSVGIGTTTISSFGTVVEVKGPSSNPNNVILATTNTWSALSSGTGLRLGTGATSGNTYGLIDVLQNGGSNAGGNLIIVPQGGVVGIGTTSPSGAYRLDVSGNIRTTTGAAFATSSGNVLIGTTTDAGYRLDVSGTTRISGTELRLDNGTAGTINLYSATPTINFFSAGGYSIGRSSTTIELKSSGSIIQYIGSNQAYQIDATNGHLFKSAIAGSASLARLTTGGNMIIGSTTDNGQRLQIVGSLRIDGQTSGSAGGSSGLHLIVNCDGTNYKIALNNV